MIYQKKNWGHRTSKIVKSRQSSSNGHLPYHLFILWLSARARAWRGMWICVRSKDAQKQLARTSLSCPSQGQTFHTAKHRRRRTTARKTFWKAFWRQGILGNKEIRKLSPFSFRISLRWLIHIINSVDKTKLSFSISRWPDGMTFLIQWHDVRSSGMTCMVRSNGLRSNDMNLDSITRMWLPDRMMCCSDTKPDPMTWNIRSDR